MKGVTDGRIDALTTMAFEVREAPSGLEERLSRIAAKSGVPAPRRRTLRPTLVLAAVAGLAVAGAAFRHWAGASTEAGFSDLSGRTWRVAAIHGSIRFFDSEGRPMASTAAGGTSPADPTIVTVAGQRFVFSGIGRHKMRGTDGKLYGYAEVGPVEDRRPIEETSLESLLAEREAAYRKSTGTGVQGGMAVAMGHDAASGVFWKVVGQAYISGSWPSGDAFVSEALPVDRGSLTRMGIDARGFTLPDAPQLLWMVGSTSGRASGYGTYEIRDARGKALMTIVLARLPARP